MAKKRHVVICKNYQEAKYYFHEYISQLKYLNINHSAFKTSLIIKKHDETTHFIVQCFILENVQGLRIDSYNCKNVYLTKEEELILESMKM